jgi:hypothetical protein
MGQSVQHLQNVWGHVNQLNKENGAAQTGGLPQMETTARPR